MEQKIKHYNKIDNNIDQKNIILYDKIEYNIIHYNKIKYGRID